MLSSCHVYPYLPCQTIQYASQSMNAVTTKANATERYKFLLELSGAALNTASLFFLTRVVLTRVHTGVTPQPVPDRKMT